MFYCLRVNTNSRFCLPVYELSAKQLYFFVLRAVPDYSVKYSDYSGYINLNIVCPCHLANDRKKTKKNYQYV